MLVARLDNDGDVLLSGPAVRAAAASGAAITFLCGPRGRQAASMLPGVSEVLAVRAPWIDPDGLAVRDAGLDELVSQLAARRLDQAAVLTSFHQSALPLALLLRQAGVPEVAGVSEDFPGTLLDHRLRPADHLHEADRALEVVRALGHDLAPGDPGDLRVALDPADRPGELVPDGPYVVVHPGASVPARAWAPARNAALVAELARRGVRTVVTGAPAERELTARVAGPPHPLVTDLGGRTSFPGLAHVLREAAVVVVGNTGPAHLAAALGTPVVSLFAPTVPAVKWRPRHVPHELLHRDVPCAGCRARTCPVPGHPCLGGVTVAEVVAAVERQLAGRSSSNQTTVRAGEPACSTPQRSASRSTIPSP